MPKKMQVKKEITDLDFSNAVKNQDNIKIIKKATLSYHKIIDQDELNSCGLEALWKSLQCHNEKYNQKFNSLNRPTNVLIDYPEVVDFLFYIEDIRKYSNIIYEQIASLFKEFCILYHSCITDYNLIDRLYQKMVDVKINIMNIKELEKMKAQTAVLAQADLQKMLELFIDAENKIKYSAIQQLPNLSMKLHRFSVQFPSDCFHWKLGIFS